MKGLFRLPAVQFALTIAPLVAIGGGFLHYGGKGRLVELVVVGAGMLLGYVIGAPLNAILAVATAGGFVILEAAYSRLDADHAISGTLYAVGIATSVVFAGFLRRAAGGDQRRHDRGPGPLQARPMPGSLEYELQRSLRHDHGFSLLVARPDDLEERARYGPYGLERIFDRVASTIAEQLRGTDVARRRGNSDFWVILPETEHESARVVAERIRLSLGAHEVELETDKLTRLSVSVGIASFPEDGVTAHELVKSAERALARALSLGGNRTVLHSVTGASPSGWGVKRDGEH